jgi:hypothetical protein
MDRIMKAVETIECKGTDNKDAPRNKGIGEPRIWGSLR